MKKLARIVSCLSLSGGVALAQTTLISVDGTAPGEGFGLAIAGPGDVDGDGVPDIAVGVPSGAAAGATPGVVRVLSGVDGALIWERAGQPGKTSFGFRLCGMEDIDGDGVRELIVWQSGPSVLVISGASGATIWGYGGHPFSAFGASFVGLDDVDSDGVSDFVIGEAIIKQSLEIKSGATGGMLHQWGLGLGWAVARADDLDGDGIGDVVASFHDVNQVQASKVLALSTGTKQQLFEVVAPADAVAWAASLAADADLDGDGLPEIAVADPLFGNGSGRVRVLRGSDQGVHFEATGVPGLRLGTQIAYCGDVDGDGVEDLLCGSDAVPGTVGVLRVHSGATGALVLELQGPANEAFASSVAALGDLDGDGANDVALGWPGASTAAGEVGRVIALAGPCPTPQVYCTAQTTSQGCASSIGWSGSPQGLSGARFVVSATELVPGGFGLAIYSLAGANSAPVLGGTLCVLPPFVRMPGGPIGGAGSCGGSLSVDFGAWVAGGSDPALVAGADVWIQVWSRDPGAGSGSNLSDALRFTL